MKSDHQSIQGRMSELYDVFVDWKGRLAREMPGIQAHLECVGARKVLDAGCGTGRHVKALLEAGLDAHGADASADMLEQARDHVGEPDRLHAWRMGEAPPASLVAAGPFDAMTCMGNTWTLVHAEEVARRAAVTWGELVRPGGLLLLGLKAVGVRAETGNPYMPLLKREKDGRPVWFVRFIDLDVPALEDGTPIGDMHVVVVAGDERGEHESEALLHTTSRVRAWTPEELHRWFEARGFLDVKVSGKLDDPDVPPTGEDVFVSARMRD